MSDEYRVPYSGPAKIIPSHLCRDTARGCGDITYFSTSTGSQEFRAGAQFKTSTSTSEPATASVEQSQAPPQRIQSATCSSCADELHLPPPPSTVMLRRKPTGDAAAMAHLRPRVSPTTALRSLRAGRAAPFAARTYGTDIEPERPRPPRQANEHKLGRTFQGQVMGSIGARLQREREQRERYEHWRHITDPSRNWSLTFCACFFFYPPGRDDQGYNC